MECIDEERPVKNVESKFDEIWFLFPKDDAYRHFQSTRPIRYNKIETKKEYEIALGERTHEQLKEALTAELEYRKSSSAENKLKYMKSSLNWFKTKAYEEFMNVPEEIIEEKYGKTII